MVGNGATARIGIKQEGEAIDAFEDLETNAVGTPVALVPHRRVGDINLPDVLGQDHIFGGLFPIGVGSDYGLLDSKATAQQISDVDWLD